MKALIHDDILQYIDKGRVNIPKPKIVKWVDVIKEEKPAYDSETQELKKVQTLNENDLTISYEIVAKDLEQILLKNISKVYSNAENYFTEHYSDLVQKQLGSYGTFGNEAQKLEAKKVYIWKEEITAECLLRVNQAIMASELQSTDYSQFDVTDPNVTIENILTLK